jgi:hypothetical protein
MKRAFLALSCAANEASVPAASVFSWISTAIKTMLSNHSKPKMAGMLMRQMLLPTLSLCFLPRASVCRASSLVTYMKYGSAPANISKLPFA